MHQNLTSFIITLMISCFSFLPVLNADTMDDLKAKFLERKPAVDKLLISGKIGENNQGYLEIKETLSDDQAKTLQDENSDRKKIYAAIAKKNNSPVETVGKIRAKAIADQLAKNAWYQDESGKWVKK